MGKLYDLSVRIQQHVEQNGLDVFKVRGQLAMRCGFLVSLVSQDDPDDPQKIAALREAARDVLDLKLD
jgi:hypothetical protein